MHFAKLPLTSVTFHKLVSAHYRILILQLYTIPLSHTNKAHQKSFFIATARVLECAQSGKLALDRSTCGGLVPPKEDTTLQQCWWPGPNRDVHYISRSFQVQQWSWQSRFKYQVSNVGRPKWSSQVSYMEHCIVFTCKAVNGSNMAVIWQYCILWEMSKLETRCKLCYCNTIILYYLVSYSLHDWLCTHNKINVTYWNSKTFLG